MPPEPSSDSKFEIGHILFIDIVGYSKLLIEEQKERLRQPTDIVHHPCSAPLSILYFNPIN